MILEKWYADVVDAGRVQILYRANLMLGPATLGYARHMAAAAPARSRITAGSVVLPQLIDGAVVWPADDPDTTGGWRWDAGRSLDMPLWQQGRQALHWNPMVLNGAVLGPGLSPAARGYAERLTINFGPWQLGLSCLKWGRFCGRTHSLVWIEWQGRHPRQWCLLDGQPRALKAAARDGIDCEGAKLQLSQLQSLVQESMSDGALRGLRLPRGLHALQFFRGIERKWLAQAELRLDDGTVDAGHALFEEVTWP